MSRLPTAAAYDSVQTKIATCEHCHVELQRRNLKRHLLHAHGLGDGQRRVHGLAQCPECERFYTAQNLAEHRRRMHGVSASRRPGGKGRQTQDAAALDERIFALKATLKATPRAKDTAYWDALWDGLGRLLAQRHNVRLRAGGA